MNRLFSVALLLALFAPGRAQAQYVGEGGGAYPLPQEAPMSEAERAEIAAEVAANRAALQAAGVLGDASPRTDVVFGWPLRAADGFDDYGYHGISNFVDQIPAFGETGDYVCGARTYDVPGYNHAGTDYFTWPFAWHKMDTDAVEVVAAAPGVIVFKSDGEPDRSCNFSQAVWNAVYVEHADGSTAWYGHLKNGSVTPKDVGESVETGEYLGVVGSSGNSTGPHLHFEVYDADGDLVDPYEGECNELNATSWWADQRPYYDSAINALMTHDVAPAFPSCPDTQDVVNERDAFDPGDLVYFASYYRDQLQGQISNHRVFNPDGALWQSWTTSLGVPHYAASYWWRSFVLPPSAAPGAWVFEITFEEEVYRHTFTVGLGTAAEEPAAVAGFALSEVYPNPVRELARATLTTERAQHVRAVVVDVLGRELAVLHDGPVGAGTIDLALPTGALRRGLYVLRVTGESALASHTFIVQR